MALKVPVKGNAAVGVVGHTRRRRPHAHRPARIHEIADGLAPYAALGAALGAAPQGLASHHISELSRTAWAKPSSALCGYVCAWTQVLGGLAPGGPNPATHGVCVGLDPLWAQF